ncbi:unnamed protein product [Urochloa humidicola]
MEAPKREVGDEPAAPAAGGRGGGGLAALLQWIELEDRRIQASAFFLVWGCCVMLHGTTVLNRAANPEHLLAGYALYTIGAGLVFLTLSGAGRLRRAAARVEEALRGYF